MRRKKFLFWKTVHYLSTVLLMIGAVASIFITSQTLLTDMIRYSAKFGMFALALLFAIKNIGLAHKQGTSFVTDFLRKQLPWQREQGLIAFHAFVLHAVSTASLIFLHSELHIGEYFYTVFTALIPVSLMGYLFLTSFKPVQKRVRGWKKTHSFAWALFGTILMHEFLVSKEFHTTTLLATFIAIGSLVYGLVVQHFNKRSKRQLLFVVVGFLLMGGMFLTDMVVKKPLLQIGLDDTISTNVVKVEQPKMSDQTKMAEQETTTTQPQQPAKMTKYKAGTYDGVADAHYGKLGLRVIVSDEKIEAITVASGDENSNYVKTLIGRVVEKQSTEVTGISGATRTTVGVKKAIDDALKQAVATA